MECPRPWIAALALVAACAALPAARAAQPEPALTDPVAPPAARAPEPIDPKVQERLQLADVLAGSTAVEGPGVLVTLRHSNKIPARGADKSALQIQAQDVISVLAALRTAGAEAASITGKGSPGPERVMPSTPVLSARGGVMVDGVLVAPPFQIAAIGDAALLRSGLFAPGGVVHRAGLQALGMINVQDTALLTLPAARTLPTLRYARPRLDFPGPPAVVAPARPMQPIAIVPRRTAPMVIRPVPPVNSVPAPIAVVGAPPSVESTPGTLFGGKGSPKYHAAGCRFGERIPAADRLPYASAAEATTAGKVACKVCSPGR